MHAIIGHEVVRIPDAPAMLEFFPSAVDGGGARDLNHTEQFYNRRRPRTGEQPFPEWKRGDSLEAFARDGKKPNGRVTGYRGYVPTYKDKVETNNNQYARWEYAEVRGRDGFRVGPEGQSRTSYRASHMDNLRHLRLDGELDDSFAASRSARPRPLTASYPRQGPSFETGNRRRGRARQQRQSRQTPAMAAFEEPVHGGDEFVFEQDLAMPAEPELVVPAPAKRVQQPKVANRAKESSAAMAENDKGYQPRRIIGYHGHIPAIKQTFGVINTEFACAEYDSRRLDSRGKIVLNPNPPVRKNAFVDPPVEASEATYFDHLLDLPNPVYPYDENISMTSLADSREKVKNYLRKPRAPSYSGHIPSMF